MLCRRSGANLQEVVMSKAYAVNANFQGACGGRC